MERREALKITANLLGGTLIGSHAFLAGCASNPEGSRFFPEENISLLDEIGEVILPETEDSPGAKSAKIGEFIKSIVCDCYKKKEQEIFISGLVRFKEICQEQFGKAFLKMSKEEKFSLIQKLDQKAKDEHSEENPHYFTMIKQLTIWGYFTSEPGMTKALRYNPIPGRYDGCVPYQNGEKAWSG
jgi:hypothetical protein